jgi:TP901 family phage tail tape measure protein
MADRTLTVRIIGDPSSLEKAFGKGVVAAEGFEAKMASIGKSTTKLGKSLTRNVSVPLLGVGVAGVKMAQDFDLVISRLQGLAGVSAKQAKEWREQILKLAPVVGKAPAELANGLYQISSAGVKGKAAFEALTVSAKASAAGLGDTATVADAVTSAMNAYAKSGLTAKHAADVLTAGVREGKGEASQFAPVLGKVVAVASQLGVSFDQVVAGLAQMTKLGVPAEDAATQLSATFSGLLKVTPAQAKALTAMGLSANGLRQELREKGLLATLETLKEKTRGSSVAMAEAFPNVRALRGILQLVGTSAQGTAGVFDRVKNSTAALSTAWNAYTKTDAAEMNRSLAQTKAALIELGGTLAPLVDKLAKDLGRVAESYTKLSPRQKEFVTKLAEVAIVAGPALLALGKMMTAIAALSRAYKALALSEGLASKGMFGKFGILAGLAALWAYAQKGESQKGKPAGAVKGPGGSWVDPTTGNYVVTFNGQTYQMGKAPPTPGGGGGSTSGAAGAAALTGGLSPVQKKELSYASKYGPGSGITYTWGGVSPMTGFDCSGYLMAAYAAAGVTIPHNTVAQFNDPNAIHVLPGAEQPGDGVYFKTSGPGAAPQHVGIYIGNGQFIEYFSAGKPAKINSLGAMGGYMGARRWLKIKSSGGGGGGAKPPAAAASGSGASSTYDPLAGSKGTKTPAWKGATQATITTIQGQIAATLKGLPAQLDPVEKNAVAHIKALKKKLHIHMSAGDLAKDKVELQKWGKVLHDEVAKNAKAAQAAAAAAKKKFERALSLDVSKILRDFDEKFGQVRAKFDKATQAGLAGLAAPAQTPEEKALADFLSGRQAVADAVAAAHRQTDLADAISGGDPAAIAAAQDAINQAALDVQQKGLEDAAAASRIAADKAASDAQDAYQEQRDAQWQALSDLNDDQRTALQNNLDDWVSWLETKQKSYQAFLDWLAGQGLDTGGLINPTTGQPSGGGGSAAAAPALQQWRASQGLVMGFASGGVVPGPLGRPTLAVVHGGEQVLTPGQNRGGDVIVPVYLDRQLLFKVVQKEAARDLNSGGVGVPG